MTAFIDGPATRMLVGPGWVDSAEGTTFTVYNPSTGEILASVADASKTDAESGR